MNVLTLNPTLYPGVQRSVLTNSKKGTETKQVQFLGTLIGGAEDDGYIHIYLNYVSEATKLTIVTKSTNLVGVYIVELPQADTYIVDSFNFSGRMLLDLGNSTTITSTNVVDDVEQISTVPPNYKMVQTIPPDTYTESQDGIWCDMGVTTGQMAVLELSLFLSTTPSAISVEVSEADDAIGTNAQAVQLVSSPDADGTFDNLEAPMQAIVWGTFYRTKPYVRANLAIEEGSDVRISGTIFEQPS